MLFPPLSSTLTVFGIADRYLGVLEQKLFRTPNIAQGSCLTLAVQLFPHKRTLFQCHLKTHSQQQGVQPMFALGPIIAPR